MKGAVPQEGHTSPAFNPALGAMVTTQDGYPQWGYSIGEAASALWRIRDAAGLSWADHRRAGTAACCQQAATLDLSSGRSCTAVPAKRRALAERRRVIGYTQEQLAELLDVERSTVVRWEAVRRHRSRGAGRS
ncbi:MAG: helix-turn-helix transcriptional regulator [Pseudonocardiaceae bacterium]